VALNRPTGGELLAALREFLEKTVAPQVDPATQFNLRIANNVLGVVERELAQKGPADVAEVASLTALLGGSFRDEDLDTLNHALVEKIRCGAFDAPAAQRALLAHLKTTTAAKLAIDNPRYA
jgi:Domain of unknown function (DUF6285)